MQAHINKESRIMVLAGGFSAEREVSLRSGANVIKALERLGYSNASLLDLKSTDELGKIIELKKSKLIDFALLVTHGRCGEDGCLQGFLELLQIPYSGSRVETSANCMNKVTAKTILAAHGLPVLKSACLSSFAPEASPNELSKQVLEQGSSHGFIVKPIRDGSSLGIERAQNKTELIKLAQTLEADDYFVEPFIRGIEVTTSVLEIPQGLNITVSEHAYLDDTCKNLISLPILELKPKKEFYDYEAKYTQGMTEFFLPARISTELEQKVHRYAIAAFRALGCRSYTRVDFIIKDGLEPYILELNTLPGMTDTSDMPAQAKANGISFDELVELILA